MSHHFRALVVEIACEMFGVEKKMDIESLVPDEAKNWNTKRKAQWLEQQVVPIVNAIFRPYSAPRDVKVYLKRSGVLYCVTVPPDDIGKTLELKINGMPCFSFK